MLYAGNRPSARGASPPPPTTHWSALVSEAAGALDTGRGECRRSCWLRGATGMVMAHHTHIVSCAHARTPAQLHRTVSHNITVRKMVTRFATSPPTDNCPQP
jgi:hypothetical protein